MPNSAIGGAGLRGQSAGTTSLCTVGKSGTGLTYRGYDITDLATTRSLKRLRTCYCADISPIKKNWTITRRF